MLRPHPAALVVLVRADVEIARWPFVVDGPVDLSIVDELARTQLAARRLGCSMQLHDVCAELSELLAFLGLAKVVTGLVAGVADLQLQVGAPLPVGGPLVGGPLPVGGPLQVVGEAERGEEGRVEEVVVPDDPAA